MLNNLLHGQNLKRSKMGGVRPAAEILNLMKSQQEDAAIAAVREYDQELAQKIIDEMFLFENLVEVEDRSIQRILQEIESESLIIALKGAQPELREKFSAICPAAGPTLWWKISPPAGRCVCLRLRPSRKYSDDCPSPGGVR